MISILKIISLTLVRGMDDREMGKMKKDDRGAKKKKKKKKKEKCLMDSSMYVSFFLIPVFM